MNFVLLLGILLLLGIMATRGTRLINLPNVTAYLIIGLIFAICGILVDKLDATYNFLIKPISEELTYLNGIVSTIALGFIALSIGEEFKVSQIKAYGTKMAIITFFQALLACILVDVCLVVLCLIMNLSLSIALVLGAIATATAPAATLMVVHQYKAKGPLVDILLPVVAFDDAIGLVIFAISLAISKSIAGGSSITFFSIVLLPLIEVIGSLLVGGLLGFLMHIVIKFFKSRNNHMIVIIAFTLLGVGVIESLNLIKIGDETLEFSNLLTCMMIGAVYVNMSKREDTPIVTRDLELMDRWTPFLFTLFFVLSGAHLATSAYEIMNSDNSAVLLPVVLIFIIYMIARSTGKYFGAYCGCKITKQPHTITKYLGLTLLPQAGVAIGMANQVSGIEVFKNTGNIGNIIVTVVLCATLVYELFGPLVTKWSLYKAGEIPEEEPEVLAKVETKTEIKK